MDRELVTRAREGDREALSQLLEQLAPSVYRFGQRMCGSVSDAEEVVQDTLLSVAQNLEQFEGRSSLSSWVFALARSACSRRRRGLKNAPHLPEEAAVHIGAAESNPEQRASQRQYVRLLEQALSALPDEQREVLVLRDVEGLSAAETADALGISVPATKSRLHRARAALLEHLKPQLEPASAPGCPEVARLFSQHLEGELDGRTCERMEAHVRDCTACSSACDALRHALSTCRALPDPDAPVPVEVQRAVQRALRRVADEGRP